MLPGTLQVEGSEATQRNDTALLLTGSIVQQQAVGGVMVQLRCSQADRDHQRQPKGTEDSKEPCMGEGPPTAGVEDRP